jgi:hypothetical protein
MLALNTEFKTVEKPALMQNLCRCHPRQLTRFRLKTHKNNSYHPFAFAPGGNHRIDKAHAYSSSRMCILLQSLELMQPAWTFSNAIALFQLSLP